MTPNQEPIESRISISSDLLQKDIEMKQVAMWFPPGLKGLRPLII